MWASQQPGSLNNYSCDGQRWSIGTRSSECTASICYSQYHVSESCIDKPKRAAVHLTSLGGRYDPESNRFKNNLESWLHYSSMASCAVYASGNLTFVNHYFMYISQQLSDPRGPRYSLTLLPHVSPTASLGCTAGFITVSFTCAPFPPSFLSYHCLSENPPSPTPPSDTSHLTTPCWSPPLLPTAWHLALLV